MKRKWFAMLAGITTATNMSVAAAEAVNLTSTDDKVSYSIGFDLGKNFRLQDIKITPKSMCSGLQDGVDNKPQITEEQMKAVLTQFQKDIMAKRTAEFNKQAEENKKQGEDFLAANKTKPGVVTLPSGLQYKVITEGKGAKPGKDDTVTVDYTGTLINGQVFDSTEKTGKPATFKLSQVIPGWTEALQLMPAGSVWEIYVPANLAYGPRSVGGPIGPNATLIFKVNLLSVKK